MTEGRDAMLAFVAMTVAALAHAQSPPMVPTEQPLVAAPRSKQCESANRKVDREQKALAAAAEGMARDQRAREGCTGRGVCARHDNAIADAQRRVARREVRLARFRNEASAACKVG